MKRSGHILLGLRRTGSYRFLDVLRRLLLLVQDFHVVVDGFLELSGVLGTGASSLLPQQCPSDSFEDTIRLAWHQGRILHGLRYGLLPTSTLLARRTRRCRKWSTTTRELFDEVKDITE